MVGKATDPILAVGAGVGAGGIVYTAFPEPAAWASAALLWTLGMALAIHGYRLVPTWDVRPADEHAALTVTTRRGWTLLAFTLSWVLAAFYVVFARAVLAVPPSVEIWFMVTMAATGPAIAGLVSWVATDPDVFPNLPGVPDLGRPLTADGGTPEGEYGSDD